MTAERSLGQAEVERLAAGLRAANLAFGAAHPGEPPGRQPVHTVYGGAHLFGADTAPKLGALARAALDRYAPDAAAFADVFGWPPDDVLASRIRERVAAKLATEPVEDFRADFEDGYGQRPDAEEDGHADQVARELARGLEAGTLPPFVGIRIKPLTEEHRARSARTLDICLTALAKATGGRLPEGFVVTLPKVTVPEQVGFAADLLDRLEAALALPPGTVRFELMIEMPQDILGPDGANPLRRLVSAGRGRVGAAHFGTYDYTAGLAVTADQQRMRHPACDFAKHALQVALAGTGTWLSDGATAILPVPPHAAEAGGPLSLRHEAENRAAVHRAWRLHYEDVQHSLAGGFYQGWDLHPAQLVTRYAAVYHFFLTGLEAAGARLRAFVARAAQATLVGDVFDDAATGQGLLNYFLRAMNCGAVTEAEALAMTGLTLEELRGRSFVRVLRSRGRS